MLLKFFFQIYEGLKRLNNSMAYKKWECKWESRKWVMRNVNEKWEMGNVNEKRKWEKNITTHR